jgi:hypothetical protein
LPGKTRAIVATTIGNMLEWYDFTVYALFTTTPGLDSIRMGCPRPPP